MVDYSIQLLVNGELNFSGNMSVNNIEKVKKYIKELYLESRFYLDKTQMNRILFEYLGIHKEDFDIFFNKEQLEKDINFIIDKYANDTRKIQYILESDIQYAYDNEKDIRIIENVNGIIVYEDLI